MHVLDEEKLRQESQEKIESLEQQSGIKHEYV